MIKQDLCLLFSHLGLGTLKNINLFLDIVDTEKNFKLNLEKAKKSLLESFSEIKYAKILYSIESNFTDRIKQGLAKSNVGYVTYFSDEYPDSLKNIEDPPICLYYKGDVSLLKTKCLSIIGSRKTTAYARRITETFTSALSQQFTIVSGLAYGIDALAHVQTLENNGKTIAVLGSGFEHFYPKENEPLAIKIINNGGLIISEYHPHEGINPYQFVRRNRIVSGLSLGVLVVSAGLKSGTFTTVDFALDQGKDIFAVPGEIFDQSFAGCNELIKKMQSALVTKPQDILDYYGVTSFTKQKSKTNMQLDILEETIVNLLINDKLHFNEIVAKSHLSTTDVNYLLTNLELKSIITKLPGNMYCLNGEIE